MNRDDIRALSLVAVRDAIAAGDLSATEVTEAALEQAERFDASHHLFITYTPQAARAAAAEADARRAAGRPLGPLHGVPITVKDNIAVAGLPCTAGSLVLKESVPAEDATVVARLKAAGAVLLGKVNLHEMAMGGTSINPHYGAVGNAWRPDWIAGGSSGASAACVALRIGYASLGTDAGGSVRIPSMCNGIVGLKQTHGLVSLFGGVPSTSNHNDHIGPHARSVADVRLMLELMAGYDDRDPHSSPMVAAPAEPLADLTGIRVGVPETYFWADLHPEIEARCRAVVELMRAAGAVIVPMSLDIGTLLAATRAVFAAEAYVFHEPLLREHPELYSEPLRLRLLAGQYVLAHDYVRSLRARRLAVEAIREALAGVDVLAMPTLPVPPYPQAEDDGFTQGPMLVRNTSPFNQDGSPAITLPAGLTAAGQPIGFQLVASAFQDYRLLAIAEVVERLVGFDAVPPVLRDVAAGVEAGG